MVIIIPDLWSGYELAKRILGKMKKKTKKKEPENSECTHQQVENVDVGEIEEKDVKVQVEPSFCPMCGLVVEHDWVYCPKCGCGLRW